MEGLEMVARDSLTRIQGSFDQASGQQRLSGQRMSSIQNEEAALSYFSGIVNTDDDERNWSFSYLRQQLKLKLSSDLFRRYQKRVQHALFVEMLLMNVLVNAIALAAMSPSQVNSSASDEQRHQEEFLIFTFRFSRGLNLAVQAFLFVAAFTRERWFNGCLAATLTLIFVLIGEMSTDLVLAIQSMERDGPGSYTRSFTYYIVLASTVLLSFPSKRTSAIAACVVIIIDRGFSILSNLSTSATTFQAAALSGAAESIFLIITLLVGLSIRYIIEVMGRRAFLDRRECLESKIKIENEKDREEELLQSVLPKHIAKEVREDIRTVMNSSLEDLPSGRKPFKKLYVERYEDVSILYADIVNSMLLGASLCVADLVDTLNDLFGRFDEAAQNYGCMRIKLLGDCYYCVSGFQTTEEQGKCSRKSIGHHSDNCVHVGLRMIDIIREIRESRNIDVDMRIGVHSGSVLGGLVGLSKWQFDIWSRDVTIASHMEQSGVPGHVHITKVTKDHLKGNYVIKPGDGHLRDPYLDAEGIRTFLVVPSSNRFFKSCEYPHKVMMQISNDGSTTLNEGSSFSARKSSSLSSESSTIPRRSSEAYYERQSSNFVGFIPKRRRHVLDYSLIDFKKMVDQVNKMMEKAIDKMALSKKDQWCSNEGVQPFLLTFRKGMVLEIPYQKQPDPLFKYYLSCSLLIFMGITLIHLLILPQTLGFWITFCITLMFVLTASFASWAGYLERLILKRDELDSLKSSSSSRLLNISRTLWKTTSIRVSLVILVCLLILVSSLVGIGELSSLEKESGNTTFSKVNGTESLYTTGLTVDEKKQFYTFCVALALTATSVFLRIHYLLKLLLKVITLAFFFKLYLFDMPSEDQVPHPNRKAFGTTSEQSFCFYLTFVAAILHVLDRQVEYVCRLDFVWRTKLQQEREEATRVEVVNRMLLHNILPSHVTQFYLDTGNRRMPEAPYHEECSSVAILFASIPSFANCYVEHELNEAGRRCIQLLNEIICDFDQLLSKKFRTVEKIKTIGSTYMAACGLTTSTEHHSDSFTPVIDEGTEQDRKQNNVTTLARFATSMIACLNEFNKHAMQDFRLRAGIAVGRVMAGVVGTVKPQYDIWGDAVNVASRMDSTGIPGRIQVTEEVADIIRSSVSFECECRGEIFVKGKGKLTTFFLKTPHDQPDIENTML